MIIRIVEGIAKNKFDELLMYLFTHINFDKYFFNIFIESPYTYIFIIIIIY